MYPPVVGEHGYVGSATYWDYSSTAIEYNPSVTSVASNITSFPITDVSRTSVDSDSEQFWWLGGLADGTQIPSGKYIMRISAQLPYGDLSSSSGWTSWTQPFTVTK